jgi:hypothetical protein
MDPRKLLCIFLFAQMALVGYAALAVRVGAKAVRNQGYDTSRVIHFPVLIARDYWFFLWLALLAVFVLLLRLLVKSGPDWRESLAIFAVSFGIALLLAANAVFATVWSVRPQTYGYSGFFP